jgi:hypothetical protein
MAARPRSSTPLQIGIIVLTCMTAVTHLTLNFPDPIFILNGLGYLVLLAAVYLPLPFLAPYRRSARWALIGYTALTIVLWLAIGARSPIGFVNKANELLLLALLLRAERRARG